MELWLVLAGLIFVLVCLLFQLFYYYYKLRIHCWYLLWALVLFSFFIIGGINEAHLHHYLVAQIMLSFMSYRNIFLTIMHGIFNGVMIEGVSRWGLDPIWYDNGK